MKLIKEKAQELFNKFHHQILNDCGLMDSPSTETAARNCAIIAAEEVKGQSEYDGDQKFWDDVIHQLSLIEN